jgi:hypothetical protein
MHGGGMSIFILMSLAIGWIEGSLSPQLVEGSPNQEQIARQLTKGRLEIKVDDHRADRPVIALSIPCYDATDDVLGRLTVLPDLQELRILESQSGINREPYPEGNVTDAGVGQLRKLKKIRLLSIPSPWLTDAGMAYLGEMAQLTELTIGNERGYVIRTANSPPAPADWLAANITNKGFKHLEGLHDLRSLSLRGTCITDEGLRSLARLTRLQTLSLMLIDHSITERGFARLQNVPSLRSLDIVDDISSPQPGAMNSSLACLTSLPALESLTIFSTRVTDDGLLYVGQIKTLRYLHLYHVFAPMPVTDAGLEHLMGLKELRSLRLGIDIITDRGLACLSGLERLETLEVGARSAITDSGLQAVSRLSQLKELTIPSYSVTKKGIAALPRSLPALKVCKVGPS